MRDDDLKLHWSPNSFIVQTASMMGTNSLAKQGFKYEEGEGQSGKEGQ